MSGEKVMKQWHDLMTRIINEGEIRHTRRGETLAVFGTFIEFPLYETFPAVTTKKLYFNSVAAELAGFLRAEDDAQKMGSKIWEADAQRWHKQDPENSFHEYDMGRVYGVQWRQWDHWIDQLADVVNGLQEKPYERYHLVTAWNPSDRHFMCLEPCHYAFQFFRHGAELEYLSCIFHMRSVDVFLGLPFDIASYALLTSIVANQLGLIPYRLKASLGDTHLYLNHMAMVRIALAREPLPEPRLLLDPKATIDNFTPGMATLVEYDHWPALLVELNNEL
jgi:thymidylate synthase